MGNMAGGSMSEQSKARQMPVKESMWLRHGEPIPEGWDLVCETPSHHTTYSRLITRRVPESKEQA